MAKDVINLSTENLEVPSTFTEAFAAVKQTVDDSKKPEVSEEKTKRGRPRKVKDELDTTVKDEADAVIDEPELVDADEPDEEVVEEEIEDTQKGAEYIPDEWVDAGREAGLSDETIQELAATKPETLKRLAGAVEKTVKTVAKARREPEPQRIPDDLFKPIELKLDKDVHGEELVNTVDALVKRLNEQNDIMRQLKNQNDTVGRDMQVRQVKAKEDRFDSMLDKASTDMPAVGMSEKIKDKSSEFTTRKQIWDKADALRKGDPSLKFEESVEDALAWYRGKHGTKYIEQETVKKLKARAGKLTYKPTHKAPAETAYKSEEEEAVARIERVRAKYKP